jgi:hypothetical protein
MRSWLLLALVSRNSRRVSPALLPPHLRSCSCCSKGPWTSHGSATGGYYVCNKYDEDQKKVRKLLLSSLLADLRRLSLLTFVALSGFASFGQGVTSDEESKILRNTKILQKYTYYYKVRSCLSVCVQSPKLGFGVWRIRVLGISVMLSLQALYDHRWCSIRVTVDLNACI